MLNCRKIVAVVRDGDWLTPERICIYPRVFLVIFFVVLTWLVFSPIGSPWNGSDFVGFWVPAHLAFFGHATDIYDQRLISTLQQKISGQSDVYLPWIYPPTFLLLILPLGALPYMTAFVVWIAASLAVYGVTLRTLARREGFFLALAFPGVVICIYNGHAEFLLAGLFGGAMLLFDRRPYISGMLIGLCSVKPHLFLMVPVALVAGGRWGTISVAAMVAMLGGATSAAVFGADIWRDFISMLSGINNEGIHVVASFMTVSAKQQSAFAFGFRMDGPIVAISLQAAITAFAAWGVAITWAKDYPLEERSVVLCCGTLLASPYLFDYDLVLLAAPIALLARDGLSKGFRPWQKSLLSALWIAPSLVRSCSYYLDMPVTVTLLVLTIAFFIASPSRRGLGSQQAVFGNTQKSTLFVTD